MAYRADIEIGVKGGVYLDQLQNKLTQVSKAIDALNAKAVVVRRTIAGPASDVPMGPGGAGVTSASAQAAAFAVERRVAEMRRTEAQTAIKSVKDRAFAENYIANVIERRIQAKQKELAIERQQTAEILRQRQVEDQQTRQQFRSRAGTAISSGLIGGGFPLLFGQGAGAAAGGAIGGLAGGVLGGGFGFALSVIGTAIGQAADESDKFTRSLGQLNAGVSGAGNSIKITATDVNNLAKNLGVAKDEAIKLLSAFAGFKDAATSQALLAIFGENPNTFKELAAVKDKADLAKVILNNYEKISAQTALQLINQLKLTDSATVELAFQKALLDAEIRKTEEGLKQITVQDRLLAGLATAGALMGGSATFISPEVFGQERVKQFRAQRPKDPIQNALKALGVLRQANVAAEALKPDTKAANAAERAAEKAAREAEREAQRVSEELRTRQLNSMEIQKQLMFTEKIAKAEMAKDEILVRELEGEFELARIGIEAARQLEKEKNTRVQLAITREAQLKRELVILKTNLDNEKVDAKRAEEYKNLLRDLDYELEIKYAVTEQERERLRIALEMAKLGDQNIYKEDQLLAIQERKQKLAKPIMGTDLIKKEIGTMQDELKLLTDSGTQVISTARSIGDAFGLAMTNSVSALTTGTQTIQQVFADFLNAVAEALLSNAARMIATYVAIGIARQFAGLGSKGGAGESNAQFMERTGNLDLAGNVQMTAFADGGYPPVGRPSLVGENGPELFVPGRQGLVVPNDIFAATRAALNQGGTSSSAPFEENAQALAVSTSYNRERVLERDRQTMLTGAGGSMVIQTEVINNVEYATVDQVAQAAAASARQARAQVIADMRNKPSTRASLGLR